MSLDQYDAMLGAVRAEHGDDAELAVATHLRLRRSLETRARGRHQLAGLVTAVAILLVGTVSWALATGRVTMLWAPAPRPRVSAAEVAPPAPPPPRRRAQPAIATAPDAIAESMKRAPSVLLPATAKNRSPGLTARLSTARPFTSTASACGSIAASSLKRSRSFIVFQSGRRSEARVILRLTGLSSMPQE